MWTNIVVSGIAVTGKFIISCYYYLKFYKEERFWIGLTYM